MRTFAVTLGFVLLAACSKSATTTADPAPEGSPDGVGAGAERQELTAAECEAQGGAVVGDIGDGAIHRPDYRCPDSGEAPIGTIVPAAEGPIAIEGAVCCK